MKHTNEQNIGLLISSYRTKLGITQDELSKSCGIHRTTISDIERGVSSPSLDVLQKICNTLNIDLLQLFGLSSDRQSFKIHQPHNGNLGSKIIEQLNSSSYSRLSISVAYAKISGVNRLKPYLLKFKQSNGQINCFVGIDQCNTTYEALCELFKICDNLYIIHNQNLSHTYHHKVYMFDQNNLNPEKVWLAIGSNNLTAGGLFINYESCSVDYLDLSNFHDKTCYKDTLNLFELYANESYSISSHVDSIEFIDKLLVNKYIIKERQSRITKNRTQPHNNDTNFELLFGRETFTAPPLNYSKDTYSITSETHSNFSSEYTHTDEYVPTGFIAESNDIVEYLESNEIKESFWFEMRKSTGGSRNILDLSSTAKLLYGDATGTKYYNELNSQIGGSVEFFDINPFNHNLTKDVTISFNGNDYNYSTILYASNNKSWRIQLKGDSSTDHQALSQYGKTCFVDNILIFHKITPWYYILDIVSSSELESLKKNSIFVASNGISKAGKLFGKLK